jgi:hypothetical protein
MLNPSTADAQVDDPTIRRCISFAKREGCTELTVVNLFALRATNPRALGDPRRSMAHAIGPDNTRHLCEQANRHDIGIKVAAWGSHPATRFRIKEITNIMGPMLCLGTTKDGSPRHPLYVRKDAPLIPWVGLA